MQFGLDGSRRGGRSGDHSAAYRELLPLAALVGEAAGAGLMAGTPTGPARAERLIGYSGLLREIARRSGQIETLARAASAAGRARREAGSTPPLRAAATYELAETQRLAFTLIGDIEAAVEARAYAAEALTLNPEPLVSLRLKALTTRIDGAEALAVGDRPATAAAIEALELVAKGLSALRAPDAELAALNADRADLLIGLGVHGQDRALLLAAATALTDQVAGLDPDALPLSWMRAQTLRGQALAALGDIAGDPAAIAEGVAALNEALTPLPTRHSPLDTARAGHGLGLALQSMGEACEEEALFDAAVKAFSPALEALDRAPTLPYRAVVAHDGAMCLARRAERRGDLKALEQAEAVFRASLKTRTAAVDPLAWAVTQVALARIYEAQAGLRPDRGERADAAFALASALDVFTERGMRTLSAATLAALERVRETA